MGKVTLLIDADIIAFKYASTNQQTIQWGDVDTITTTPLEEVYRQLDACLKGYLEVTKATDLIICLTDDESNWRTKVLPSYKGNRKEAVRPTLLKDLKNYLAETYPSYRKPTLEADDIMGILSTHPKLVSGKKIIVSEDKDMKTIPGWLWNPAKDSEPWLVTPQVANYWHYLQTLIGDTTDGYKGCPGVGKETADELLKKPYLMVPYEHTLKSGKRKGEVEIRHTKEPTDDVWKAIVSLYEYHGLNEQDALVQARVARICRHTDYNFIDGKEVLWNPQ